MPFTPPFPTRLLRQSLSRRLCSLCFPRRTTAARPLAPTSTNETKQTTTQVCIIIYESIKSAEQKQGTRRTMCPPSISPLQPVTTRPAHTTPNPIPVPSAVGGRRAKACTENRNKERLTGGAATLVKAQWQKPRQLSVFRGLKMSSKAGTTTDTPARKSGQAFTNVPSRLPPLRVATNLPRVYACMLYVCMYCNT